MVDSDGTVVHRGDRTGIFVFTREGRLAVQVMDRTPQAAPQAGPEQYARGGYEATFGRFEVDERTHTFTYHVEGSLVRTLVGEALPRAFNNTRPRVPAEPRPSSLRVSLAIPRAAMYSAAMYAGAVHRATRMPWTSTRI